MKVFCSKILLAFLPVCPSSSTNSKRFGSSGIGILSLMRLNPNNWSSLGVSLLLVYSEVC